MDHGGSFRAEVYALTAMIPEGKVATYGQLALLAGNHRGARAVGWAMQSVPRNLRLPCHRVVNRYGTLAPDHVFGGKDVQRDMLLDEGITFLPDGRIDMRAHLWQGPRENGPRPE